MTDLAPIAPETVAAGIDPATGRPSRRSVLVAGGVVAAAAAFTTACGSSSGGGAATSASSPASTPSTASVSPSASASTPTAAAPAAGTTVTESDVPVGGGTILAAAKVVVTQPKAGVFKAFTAVCTHQGCLVASVENGVIACPCHGSQFSAADGSVQSGPAPAPLAEVPLTVSGTTITVTA